MTIKKTEYRLLPKQGEFLFGVPEDKIGGYIDQDGDFVYLNDVALYQGGVTCVPADCEYLTPTGWKRIDTLTKDTEMAVYHEDGYIRFEKPKEIFTYPADVWYDFDTRFVKQTLCPNHKIVYFKDSDKDMLNPQFISCKDYVTNGCNQHYKIRNYFKTEGSLTLDLTEVELRLLVAYQADGYNYKKIHGNKSPRSIGFHLKKKNKIDRLVHILQKTDFKYTIKERTNGIKKGFVDIFVEEDKGIANYKNFTPEMYSLGNEQLSVIFDEVKYWDCSHKNSCTTEGSWTYSSSNKDNRDFIQFVCASQGFCTTCYERTRDIKIAHNNKDYNYKSFTEYTVSWTVGKPVSLGKPQVRKAKGGESKFCPSTSTKMWLARYKNYIFVTGNS